MHSNNRQDHIMQSPGMQPPTYQGNWNNLDHISDEFSADPLNTVVVDGQGSPAVQERKSSSSVKWLLLFFALLSIFSSIAYLSLPGEGNTAILTWKSTQKNVIAPAVYYTPKELLIQGNCRELAYAPNYRLLTTIPATELSGQLSTNAQQLALSALIIDKDEISGINVSSHGQRLLSIDTNSCQFFQVLLKKDSIVIDTDRQSHKVTGEYLPSFVGFFRPDSTQEFSGITAKVMINNNFQQTPSLYKKLAGLISLLSIAFTFIFLLRSRSVSRPRSPHDHGDWENSQNSPARSTIHPDSATPKEHTPPIPLPAHSDLATHNSSRRGISLSRAKNSLYICDIIVIIALIIWHFIGANTADDGYILTMATQRPSAHYDPNYYRWFGAGESPFGWFYWVYTLLADVCLGSAWLRLPELILAIICWLLLAHVILPIVTKTVGISEKTASAPIIRWGTAAIFLLYWFTYNNGLRPENIIACGLTLTMCVALLAVRHASAWLSYLALVISIFTFACGPTGIIVLVPIIWMLFNSSATLIRLGENLKISSHKRLILYGITLTVSALCSVIPVAFYFLGMQTFIRKTIIQMIAGPSFSWYEEYFRYNLLFSYSADGSMPRRISVLSVVIALVYFILCIILPKISPEISIHPLKSCYNPQRLLSMIAATIFMLILLSATPTKPTHHLGALAPLATILVYVALCIAHDLHFHNKARAAGTISIILLLAAFAYTGPNKYWYVSSSNILWSNTPIRFGKSVGTELLCLSIIFGLIASWYYLKSQYRLPETSPRLPASTPDNRERENASSPILTPKSNPTLSNQNPAAHSISPNHPHDKDSFAALTATDQHIRSNNSEIIADLGSDSPQASLEITDDSPLSRCPDEENFLSFDPVVSATSTSAPPSAPEEITRRIDDEYEDTADDEVLLSSERNISGKRVIYFKKKTQTDKLHLLSQTIFAIVIIFTVAVEFISFAIPAAISLTSPANSPYSIAKGNFHALEGKYGNLGLDLYGEFPGHWGILPELDKTDITNIGKNIYGFSKYNVPSSLLNAPENQIVAEVSASETANELPAEGSKYETTPHLPYGLPASLPFTGNYTSGFSQTTPTYKTGWYKMDKIVPENPILVSTVAGDAVGKIYAEFTDDIDEPKICTSNQYCREKFIDAFPGQKWRNIVVDLRKIHYQPKYMRLVVDPVPIGQWVAFTAPRVPLLRPIVNIIGGDPVLIDWSAGLAFPTLNQMNISQGMQQIPRWRILPDRTLIKANTDWESAKGGGPLGLIESYNTPIVWPIYPIHELGQDYGALERYTPIISAIPPQDNQLSFTHEKRN